MTATAVRRPRFDALRVLMLATHFFIVAYVCLGWQQTTRVGLFAYTLVLPLIIMQWLFNGGTSFVSNIESLIRNGHWRDPENPFEGRLFQSAFALFGLRFTLAQINTLCTLTMAMFWVIAALRMILIPT